MKLRIAVAALVCLIAGLAFTALGVAIAWFMESTRGFHAVMNLFLLPLWILSGAFFPYDGASPALQWCIKLNPVSYAVDALRIGMYYPEASHTSLQPLSVSLIISLAFAVLMIGVAVRVINRPLFKD